MFPTKERQVEYLEAQKQQIIEGNFKNKIARELHGYRLGVAKKKGDKEETRAIEDELEKLDLADEGNAEYLKIIDKFIKEV